MKTRIFISILTAMLFTLISYSQDGATVFKKNCGVCHTIGNGKLVGPDLKGSDKKHDMVWLKQWIKSSQTMVKKKDPKAIQIFNDNKQMIMPDQALSDAEIKTVMAFIGEETTKLEQPSITVSPVQASVPMQNFSKSDSDPLIGINSTTIIYILLTIITFLTAILIGLSRIIKDIAVSKKKWTTTPQADVASSDIKTKHITNALSNENVAGTIIPDIAKTGAIKGIQFIGRFVIPAGEILEQAKKKYYSKYPFSLALRGDLWAIELVSIKMVDNTLGFGKKLSWEKEIK